MSSDTLLEHAIEQAEILTLNKVLDIFDNNPKKVDCERKIRRILTNKLEKMEENNGK